MNLQTVRQWFVEESGRYDLQNADGTDNGANKYIQAGTRLLDRITGYTKAKAVHIEDVSEGAYKLDIKNCRAVQEVWVADSDGRYKLERRTFSELREAYSTPESDVDTGRPLYWAERILNLEPEQESATSDDFSYDHYHITFSSDVELYRGIYWMPPADGTYTMNIFGLFESKKLEDDTDDNYWSVNFPHLLVRAAIYALEVGYRNRAGARAELENIMAGLQGLMLDDVEQSIVDCTELEG